MRILIYGINYAPEPTGAGKYTGEMAEWLSRKGHDVRVVTAPPYYPEWAVQPGYSGWQYQKNCGPADQHAAMVWRCPLWVPRRPTGVRRLLHLGSFAIASMPAAMAQLRWRPALVVCIVPTLACAPIALAVARVARAKAWLHVQDFEVDAAFDMRILRSGLARRWFLWGEKFLLRRFNRVSTISARMLERLEAKEVEGARRVSFPNWTNLSAIRPLSYPSPFRKELRLPQGSIVALYAGNIGEKQGLEILVEAARRTESDPRLLWVIAGAGSARQRLENLSSGCDNLRWLPLQPAGRLNDLLNLADIHLLPQRADAADLVMPSKLTNMLASGRPVVATAAAGTEIARVVSGRGIVAEPGSAESLADAVTALTSDGERRQALGAEARAYAEQFLDRDPIMRSFEREALALVGGE